MNSPLVSVIIPNYNHADFLEERVESVMQQSFTDFEVLLFDDASTDKSVEVIKKLQEKYPQINVYINKKNSGSPFAQWNKGANLARGKYIWIAESDDVAAPNLLENLVNQMKQDDSIGIAYCQSLLINQNGETLNSYAENLKFIYKSNQWDSSFVKSGESVCRQWLIKHNPIPNASAALFNKQAFLVAGGAEAGMRLNGDWFTYCKILLKHNLSFNPAPLNKFRVHQKTQRERSRATADVYLELIKINDFLRANISNIEKQADDALAEIASWWTGSLPYQIKTKENRKKNQALYQYFKTKKPRLALHIILTYGIIGTRFLLNKLGILKPVKQLRSKLFPGKYFDY